MFRRFIVLFAILLQLLAVASQHVTIGAPIAKCKTVKDCPVFGHDHVDCINEKCVTLQHKKKSG